LDINNRDINDIHNKYTMLDIISLFGIICISIGLIYGAIFLFVNMWTMEITILDKLLPLMGTIMLIGLILFVIVSVYTTNCNKL